MRKLALVAVLLSVIGVATGARAGRPEACFAASPATVAFAASCEYKATVKGGIDGFGSFTVTIARDGRTTTINSAHPPSACYVEGPRTLCPIGIVQPGDDVTVHAAYTPAFVGVGNPCPVPNPGVPPPVLGGEC